MAMDFSKSKRTNENPAKPMGKSIPSAAEMELVATAALPMSGKPAAAAMPNVLFLKKFLLLCICNRFKGFIVFLLMLQIIVFFGGISN
jgi:hypothetical protein